MKIFLYVKVEQLYERCCLVDNDEASRRNAHRFDLFLNDNGYLFHKSPQSSYLKFQATNRRIVYVVPRYGFTMNFSFSIDHVDA